MREQKVVKSKGVVILGGRGVFENVHEETDRGVKQVPLSQVQILEEYKVDSTEFRRIRFQKVVKSGRIPNPNEEVICFRNRPKERQRWQLDASREWQIVEP